MRNTKYFDLFIILEKENNQLYRLAKTSNRMSKCYVMVVTKLETSEYFHVIHSLIIAAFLGVSSSIKKEDRLSIKLEGAEVIMLGEYTICSLVQVNK